LGECLSLVCTLTVMCIIAVGHHWDPLFPTYARIGSLGLWRFL
jgi:hypothetical protein